MTKIKNPWLIVHDKGDGQISFTVGGPAHARPEHHAIIMADLMRFAASVLQIDAEEFKALFEARWKATKPIIERLNG